MKNYIIDPTGSDDNSFINATNYKLFSHDVRKTEELGKVLVEEFQVDPTRPTLLLTECLLIYLKPEDSVKIVKWSGEFFSKSSFLGLINYEMIEPFDTFGQTMVNNLMERGCDLQGIEGTPTLAA